MRKLTEALALILALLICACALAEEIIAAPVEEVVEEITADLFVDDAESDLAAPERDEALDSAVLPAPGSLVTITKPSNGATIAPGDVELWCRFDNSAFSGSSDVWKFASISVEVLRDGALYDTQTISVGGWVSFEGNGQRYATLSLIQPGEYTIRASVPGSPDVWDSVTITIGDAEPTDSPYGDDTISPDAPQTTRRPTTADNLIVITSPKHGAKLSAGKCQVKARFNPPSGVSDLSAYGDVQFQVLDSKGEWIYAGSGGVSLEHVTDREFDFFDYNFEMGGIYSFQVRVGENGTWDRVDVAVTGPAYPSVKEGGEGLHTITPKQSEYTIDLAKSDTVLVEFTMSSVTDPESRIIFSTDYCADFGEIIERVGYNRLMAKDYPVTYDEKTGMYTCEGSNTYRGLKVGTTRLHLYIDVGGRYDRHAITFNVIDSSKDQTPEPTVSPKATARPTPKPTATPKATAKPKSLKKAVVTLKTTSYTYNGKARKPAVAVKLNGKTLKKDRDYKVAYFDNKAVGTATVKVEGIGKYTGTAKGSFKIKPKKVSGLKLKAGKKKLTVTWKKVSGVTGYQIQYSRKKDFSAAKKVTVKKAKTVKKTITKLKAGKTYYVRIRAYKSVKGKKYYSSWSKAVKKKTR